jgi:hypothetical protein
MLFTRSPSEADIASKISGSMGVGFEPGKLWERERADRKVPEVMGGYTFPYVEKGARCT